LPPDWLPGWIGAARSSVRHRPLGFYFALTVPFATRKPFALAALIVGIGLSSGASAQRGAAGNTAPPDIVGKWTGTWSSYDPAPAATPPREHCAKLDATIVLEAGVWKAAFEGDCGRPYKYSIQMEGKQSGRAGINEIDPLLESGQCDGAGDSARLRARRWPWPRAASCC
jgi:hypothetical protein